MLRVSACSYPSTPAHLILLLTLFHESQPAYKSFFTTKATFDVTPTLLVLCDISLYLLDNTEATFVNCPMSVFVNANKTLAEHHHIYL